MIFDIKTFDKHGQVHPMFKFVTNYYMNYFAIGIRRQAIVRLS